MIEPKNIEKLISHIHKLWNINKNVEITLEANPNSLKAPELKAAGINRLSLGIQALNDADLRFLGRIHNLSTALKAIDQTLKTFDNHSIDLIYARPNQKINDWAQELEQASSFGFKHLSLYQLTIEEGTPFYNQGIKPMAETDAENLYKFTEKHLKTKGYNKYEISNFSQKGFESKHNLQYWEGGDYIGIGQGAHGRLNLQAITHHRQFTTLAKEERAEELLLMGLRLTKGINKKNFQTQCRLNFDAFVNQNKKKQLEDLKLISDSKITIKATKQGLLVLNKIIEELVV